MTTGQDHTVPPERRPGNAAAALLRDMRDYARGWRAFAAEDNGYTAEQAFTACAGRLDELAEQAASVAQDYERLRGNAPQAGAQAAEIEQAEYVRDQVTAAQPMTGMLNDLNQRLRRLAADTMQAAGEGARQASDAYQDAADRLVEATRGWHETLRAAARGMNDERQPDLAVVHNEIRDTLHRLFGFVPLSVGERIADWADAEVFRFRRHGYATDPVSEAAEALHVWNMENPNAVRFVLVNVTDRTDEDPYDAMVRKVADLLARYGGTESGGAAPRSEFRQPVKHLNLDSEDAGQPELPDEVQRNTVFLSLLDAVQVRDAAGKPMASYVQDGGEQAARQFAGVILGRIIGDGWMFVPADKWWSSPADRTRP